MKVVTSELFHPSYTWDPAAKRGRIEAIRASIDGIADYVEAQPATREELAAAHGEAHIRSVEREGLYDVAALAAGGAIQAARIGLTEPCFALIRPPGHHASRDAAWGFCFFNNMAVSLLALHRAGQLRRAFVLDFDLHYGDGNVNILGKRRWVTLLNPDPLDRMSILDEVRDRLARCDADMIAISAGFDNHEEDWGGVLATEDYHTMGRAVRRTAERNGGGCYALFEGGYNHDSIGPCARALMLGMMDAGR